MLVATYSSARLTFKLIYILEAHAKDGWPMPSSRYQPQGLVVDIPSHTCIEDRIIAAKSLVEEMEVKGELLIDSIENIFNTEYGAWPTMFYVVKDGRLAFKGEYEKDKFKSKTLMLCLVENYGKGHLKVMKHCGEDTNIFKRLKVSLCDLHSTKHP